ncbi:hypothetical protein [Paenibacillus oleatilyticus]|uniref:ABC transporter permease n=1 Tax=Paenibacillus oleatilyticus TaxID=2594886 RepID=A0ABV4V793_9BACL
MLQLEKDLETDVAGPHSGDNRASSQLQLKEMYWKMAQSIDSEYAKIDWNKIAKFEIRKYNLSGSAAERLTEEYRKLSQRFEELKENGEHKTWFFAGKPYRMHSFLFASVFRMIIFESLILIGLATAFIRNYEFENKTFLVAYSTQRGRALMVDKLTASLLTAAGMVTVIGAVTLGAYFSVFDYSHLWDSPISSAFNWEGRADNLPYVSWWNLSFASYLSGSILLLYICMLLLSTMVFFISAIVKNSYFAFFLFAALFAAALLAPGIMPVSSSIIFIAACNLSVLLVNPHLWFMGNGGLTMFKCYEWFTAGSWTMITGALCIFSLKRFRKQDIY